MTGRQKNHSVTRRSVIGAAAATPALSASAPPNELLACGAAWLKMDAQVNRLTRRWARLESRAMASGALYSLSPQERLSTDWGAEMARIDQALEDLFGRRDHEFSRLERMPATDISGIAMKLAVASRLLDMEPGEGSSLVRDALETLLALFPGTLPQSVTIGLAR